MNKPTVLSVDDSGDDTLLLERACKKSGTAFQLLTVNDGQRAIDYLSGANGFSDRQRYPLPNLLLLDLKMPRKNGFEVLEWIRQQGRPSDLTIIVFTSSDNQGDIRNAYGKGANWYLMKPVDYNELLEIANALNAYLARNDAVSLSALSSFRAKPGSH